jgi:hypothetical protein
MASDLSPEAQAHSVLLLGCRQIGYNSGKSISLLFPENSTAFYEREETCSNRYPSRESGVS